MVQRWDWMTFLHWRYEPADLRPHLPVGLEVQTFDGSAWVGLLPFRMTVRFPGAPAIPWLSRFPETNVRTYVRGPDGGAGIWFLSLEAGRLVPAMTGRAGLALPYVWAEMEMARGESTVAYRSRRPWPLQHASVVRLDQDVLQADGLPPPQGPPHALFSEGVEVRIGVPRLVTGPPDR